MPGRDEPEGVEPASRRQKCWRRGGANLLTSLLTGCILFCFSERLFWTVWRPGDSMADLVVTWLAYSNIAYLFLAAAWYFRIDTFASVFLAGAIYGWLTEGVLIHTLYGTEASAPFPVSIVITALSWHALIAVLVGWYAMGRALTSDRPRGIILISAGVGAFWGIWALFLWRETPPIITPVPRFFGNVIAVTLLLAVAWWLSFRRGLLRVRPGWVGMLISAGILAMFFAQHLRRLGVFPLVVLPAVMLSAMVPLSRHRGRRTFPPQPIFPRPLRTSNLLGLLCIPAVATAVYAAAKPLGLDQLPVASLVFYWITGPLGLACMVYSIIWCARPSVNHGAPASGPAG